MKKKKKKKTGEKNHDLFLKNYYYKSIIVHEQTKKFIAFWVISSLLLKKIEFSDTSQEYKLCRLYALLFWDVDSLKISNLDKEFAKSRLRNSLSSSYKESGKILGKYLLKVFNAFKGLYKKDLTMRKANKGDTFEQERIRL